ncbi:DUF6300 family protein [Streptomyces sp. DG2A-72]|uniref:DUF6300 family protein n=1 Tax=Streptomyces sp. DG2A-72 TaxID=3051386 RepID=UPI00265B7BE1|nr:DUF6300 family protein [Streptomyces sp. DG2A-72]MDO0934238.1 DUF6300 family protein [Streptomyces sp. DG2A-72]
MPRTGETAPVELRTSGTAPPCPRCDTPVVLVARYPHAWRNRAGQRIDGLKESVLCRSCDANDPAAGELLALFAADGQLSAVRREAFDKLVHEWLNVIRDRTPNRTDLSSEEARWRAGEL